MSKQMKAIILAGGFGTRLRDVVKDVPKPMALIAGKPFLEHQIHSLKEQNVKDIILAVHYMGQKIKSYFGTGHRFGVDLTYSEEETPLGTAGAIKKAEKYIDDTFLVLNGDSYSKINLEEFLNFHKSEKSDASLSLKNCEDSSNYGNVIIRDKKIIDFLEKKESSKGLINTGIYIFEPTIFEHISPGKKVSLEEEVFPALAKKGNLYGYVQEGYFIDIGRPETYKQFKRDILENLEMSEEESVREAMQKISKNNIDLILVTNKEGELKGVINNKIIGWHFLKGGDLKDNLKEAMIKDPVVGKTDYEEEKVSELLLSGINHLPIVDEYGKIADVRFRNEEIKEEVFPIVSGKSPLRISFAGGGTDLPFFFEKYGGVVISSTIDKYCYATAVKRADLKILINSELEEILLDSKKLGEGKKLEYDGKLDIVKSVINILKPDFGFELYLHNDIPPGRGLGSSASLSVLVTKLLSQLQGISYNDNKIAEIAYKSEHEELGIEGGWQDQYAAVTGGFNFMEFGKDKNNIYPLRLKSEVINELNNNLLLCYVGESHFSGDIQKNQKDSFLKNEKEVATRLNGLKEIALNIRDSLLNNNIYKIGELLHKSWENKKNIDKSISNTKIDELYNIGINNGAYGGKLLGAGGGGYLLFFCPIQKRKQLINSLEKMGGEAINFNFESNGVQTWAVNQKY
jgi:D-glycero-alpha-D-manno-heptose-7-phosphate kinase